jgi:hypothetical protein
MAGRLRTYLILSAAGTSAAAYYLLTDGGDERVARARVNAVLPGAPLDPEPATAVSLMATSAPTPGTAAEAAVRSAARAAEKAEKGAAAVAALTAAAAAVATADGSQEHGSNAGSSIAGTAKELAASDSSASRLCHSCSGPRLWFFADRLGITPRLKRRFTPYPDPVVEPSASH